MAWRDTPYAPATNPPKHAHWRLYWSAKAVRLQGSMVGMPLWRPLLMVDRYGFARAAYSGIRCATPGRPSARGAISKRRTRARCVAQSTHRWRLGVLTTPPRRRTALEIPLIGGHGRDRHTPAVFRIRHPLRRKIRGAAPSISSPFSTLPVSAPHEPLAHARRAPPRGLSEIRKNGRARPARALSERRAGSAPGDFPHRGRPRRSVSANTSRASGFPRSGYPDAAAPHDPAKKQVPTPIAGRQKRWKNKNETADAKTTPGATENKKRR